MERDDLIINDQYSLDAHHSEEAGIQKRKTIWIITFVLTAITAFEVWLGVTFTERFGFSWEVIKYSFIILTLLKAGLIVMYFMHLGAERTNFKWVILAPYLIFICYLIYICLVEARYIHDIMTGLNWWM